MGRSAGTGSEGIELTVDEFKLIVDEINRWYPDNRIWGPSEAGKLATDFRPYDFKAAMAAVQNWVNDGDKGKRVMNAAQLRQAIAASGHTVSGPDFCRGHDHVWGIIEEKREGVEPYDHRLKGAPVGNRLAMCANCHTETIVKKDLMLTHSEWETIRAIEGEDVAAY